MTSNTNGWLKKPLVTWIVPFRDQLALSNETMRFLTMFGKLMNWVAQFILRMLLCGDQVPRASGTTDSSTSSAPSELHEDVNRDEIVVSTLNLCIYALYLVFMTIWFIITTQTLFLMQAWWFLVGYQLTAGIDEKERSTTQGYGMESLDLLLYFL